MSKENNEIPIIDEGNGGYYEVFKDAENKEIRRVFHKQNNLIKVGDIIKERLDNVSDKKSMPTLDELYTEEKETKKSNFISLDDGDSFEGQFIGVEKTTGQFGEVNSFTFVVNGEQKVLNSKSFGLLKNMVKAGVKEGDKVKITKTGQGFKTKFAVSKIE